MFIKIRTLVLSSFYDRKMKMEKKAVKIIVRL